RTSPRLVNSSKVCRSSSVNRTIYFLAGIRYLSFLMTIPRLIHHFLVDLVLVTLYSKQEIDEWMEWYNRERTHAGHHCDGRTQLQTLRDTKHLVYQKMVDRQIQQKESDTNDDVITPVPNGQMKTE